MWWKEQRQERRNWICGFLWAIAPLTPMMWVAKSILSLNSFLFLYDIFHSFFFISIDFIILFTNQFTLGVWWTTKQICKRLVDRVEHLLIRINDINLIAETTEVIKMVQTVREAYHTQINNANEEAKQAKEFVSTVDALFTPEYLIPITLFYF